MARGSTGPAAAATTGRRQRRGAAQMQTSPRCAAPPPPPPLPLVQVLRLLLDARADVDAADSFGRTALPVAADNGAAAAVRLLLQHGAAHAAKDNDGRTASELAAAGGFPEIEAALLKMQKRVVRCAGGAVKLV